MIELLVFAVALVALVVVTERRLAKSHLAHEARLEQLAGLIEQQGTAVYKQQKVMTRRLEQSKRVADKVVQDTARIREQVDVVLLDPKVQKVLNRHNGEV
jgi:hypothetical protein